MKRFFSLFILSSVAFAAQPTSTLQLDDRSQFIYHVPDKPEHHSHKKLWISIAVGIGGAIASGLLVEHLEAGGARAPHAPIIKTPAPYSR